MLSKAHLTSHSRMSDSSWVITSSWLSGLWRSYLYDSSMYSCHLFLISSASVRSIPFLSFIEPIFAWNVPFLSLIFLKRSLVFPILLFSSISLHWWLRKAFLSLHAILWNSAFEWVYLSFSPLLFAFLLFTAILFKVSSENHMLTTVWGHPLHLQWFWLWEGVYEIKWKFYQNFHLLLPVIHCILLLITFLEIWSGYTDWVVTSSSKLSSSISIIPL